MGFRVPPIRALLIDISGTLLVGSSPTPRAAEALAKLCAARIPFRLCSNTSKESSDAIHKRMQAAGLDVERAHVWTSIGALKALLKGLGVNKPYMLLSESALEECADETQVHLGQARTGSSNPSSSYDAVVVGLAPALLDYAHLNTAFRILIGEDRSREPSSHPPASNVMPRLPLIALHTARYLQASDHALSLGPGPFVRALEDATQTSATVVGKPTRAFFEAVLRDLERDLNGAVLVPGPGDQVPSGPQLDPVVNASRWRRRWEGIAVIGDDVHADLGQGAIELGLWRVLVKTGKYRPGDEAGTDALPPDHVCASFAEFVDTLLELQNLASS